MADLGIDFSCVTDLDANLSTVSGPLGHAQAIARRWLSDKGSLFYDRSYGGVNVTNLVNAILTDVQALQARLERQALEDERTESASVTVTQLGRRITIRGRIASGNGPFAFVLNVSSVTTELLFGS